MPAEWKTPRRWTPGDEITAERENVVVDDLLYLKEKADRFDLHLVLSPLDHPFRTVLPWHLRAVDGPMDGEVPTFNTRTGLFEWKPPALAPVHVPWELFDATDILLLLDHWLPPGVLENETGGGGAISWLSGRVDLSGGLEEGGWARIWKVVERTVRSRPTWECARRLAALVRLESYTGCVLKVLTGGGLAYGPEPAPYHGFGYVIENDEIYGRVADGTSEVLHYLDTVPGSGICILLEAELELLPEGRRVRWYINGNPKGETTEKVPEGNEHADEIFFASAYATEGGGASYSILSARVCQLGTKEMPWG